MREKCKGCKATEEGEGRSCTVGQKSKPNILYCTMKIVLTLGRFCLQCTVPLSSQVTWKADLKTSQLKIPPKNSDLEPFSSGLCMCVKRRNVRSRASRKPGGGGDFLRVRGLFYALLFSSSLAPHSAFFMVLRGISNKQASTLVHHQGLIMHL